MIWTIGEYRDRAVSAASYEALGAGRLLADGLGSGVGFVLSGDGTDVPEGLLKKADRVVFLDIDDKDEDHIGCHGAYAAFLKDADMDAVVSTATSKGRAVAPLLSALLGLPVVANISGMEVKEGRVLLTRPLYGGSIVETLSMEGPAMLTVLPRAFRPPPDANAGKAKVNVIPVSGAGGRVRVKEIIKEATAKDITEAEVIVSGGRGMAGKANFRLLEELASLLGGAIGASRAAVDSGWAPHSIQIGQTGKTVRPRLYVAVGISGAPQHLAGMRGSQYVMAVNKDPFAPITNEADCVITGDLFDVLPKLIRGIRDERKI